jgi:hypothetical protein
MFFGIIIRMYYAVKEVFPKNDYILLLTFENGERKEFDMKPYLNTGIFQDLKDMELFKTVRTCFDTIEWDNEADIDPETLYRKSVKIG